VSNARKRADGAFDLSAAKSEARGEPFPIAVDVDTTLLIPRPSGQTVFDLEERGTTSRQVIQILCGEHSEAVLDALADADFEVVEELAEAMQKHFGMGEHRASRG
jgi:hypothetical protein